MTVQNTHSGEALRELHGAVLDIVTAITRPQRDDVLIREAGIALDRALFPLLVRIERWGPIGIVELADRIGRDHTTVSRQVARLATLGLVERHADPVDRRMRAAAVTSAGRAMTARIDLARERLLRGVFSDWSDADVATLVRLTRRFADALSGEGSGASVVQR